VSIDAQVQSARGSVFYQKAKWGQIFKSFLNFFKFSNISFFKNFPHFEKSKKGPQVFLKTLLFLGIFPVFYLRSRCLCLKKSIFTQSLTKFVTLVQQNHKKVAKMFEEGYTPSTLTPCAPMRMSDIFMSEKSSLFVL
jgi:hypothetical protein